MKCAPKLCLTFDDPSTSATPLLVWEIRNERILEALKKHNLQAALFVNGKRVDSEHGRHLLKCWDDANQLICNHSYSHLYYNSPNAAKEVFFADILHCDSLIKSYRGYTKLFRFPFLKEGATKENRDFIRTGLKNHRYKNGYVSIDASDWFIDGKMSAALVNDSSADIKPYRDFYLRHLLERANYYNDLALKITGREIKHTLLLHHSLLNALCLDDVITMFKENGWEVVNAEEAYKDSVYSLEPDIIPAGEGIVWALAKEIGKFDSLLRYPAEDGAYEEAKLEKFLNDYKINSKD